MPSQEEIDQFVGACHGDLDTVRQMAEESPALVSARATWDETPLGAAAHMGHAAIVRFLLDCGVERDLFASIALGEEERVREYLDEAPGGVHAEGAHGIPILYHAVAAGQAGVARLLRARGADVNAGAGGNTALHAAAHFDRPELARWLIDAGADVNAKDYNGQTPLAISREKGRAAVAAVLEQAGGLERAAGE